LRRQCGGSRQFEILKPALTNVGFEIRLQLLEIAERAGSGGDRIDLVDQQLDVVAPQLCLLLTVLCV